MKKAIFACCALTSSMLNAETLWSDFSVSYLNGSHYEVGDSDKQVLTIEHAAGLSWGDSFFFMDRLESDNGDNETYAEWSPRVQISDAKFGIVENIYLAGTAEMGTFDGADGFANSFTHYLFGIGTNLKVPHFDFFKVNLYQRNNDSKDNGLQSTISWGLPLGPLYYDGFIDYVRSTDDSATSMNLTSQLKYNVAPHFNMKNKFFVGVEYVYWNNKFGIKNVDERNVNLLVKYHF